MSPRTVLFFFAFLTRAIGRGQSSSAAQEQEKGAAGIEGDDASHCSVVG